MTKCAILEVAGIYVNPDSINEDEEITQKAKFGCCCQFKSEILIDKRFLKNLILWRFIDC